VSLFSCVNLKIQLKNHFHIIIHRAVMQVHDIKTTSTHTLWIDSKNGNGRKNPDTGALINANTNNLYFDMKHTQHSLVGIAISRVRLDVRIPKLTYAEREALFVRSTGGPEGPFTLEKVTWPSRGPHSASAVGNPLIHTGAKGTFADFLATFNDLMPFNVVLVPGSEDGHLTYTSTSPGLWVAPVDCPFYRKLGFTEFKNSATIGGITYYHGTAVDNTTNGDLGGKPHDLRVPDLYLHIDMEVASEQHQRHQNIIYRTMINDKQLIGDNNTNEVPAYIDDDRVITPVELSNKFLPSNRIRLSWHYEDGTVADLDGAEWSLKLELISAVQVH